jgi:hypothetical protein
MASTYSALKIQLMTTGENSGTWGNVTNVNLGTALEEAIVGSADVTFSSADVTLTLTDSNASQEARNLRLNLTGTISSPQNLVVPAIEKVYIVNNGLTQAVTVKNSTGTGIAVPAGKTMWVYNTGSNVVDAVTHLTSLTLSTALPNSSTTASSSNGASTIVARDASGNFAAGTITANLTGNASGSAATFTSTTQNSQFNSVGVGTAGSGTAGEIRATNNITAYYSSDAKFKENVRVIDNAAAKVSAIGGKYFDWTDAYIAEHGGEDGYFIQKSDFGVIAQDVQAVFPQAVRSRPDGSLAVDYEKLSALAFAAIAELVKRIEVLEAK